ncbi:MAG: histidine kinase [Saprospiraceae bacterium]|nr:histidine kinase [Saprospiraceae bacterium]
MKKLLLLGAVCFVPCGLGAQGLPELTFQNINFWPVAKSGNSVRLPVEDRHGFLWVGSTMGAFRYDGHEIHGYFQSTVDTATLNENVISSLYSDADGIIWAGTAGGGLNRYEPITDHFVRLITPDGTLGSIGGFPHIALVDDHPVHWLPANNGLGRYDVRTNSYTIHTPETPAKRSPGFAFRFVTPDNHDADLLWVGGLDGLYRFRMSSLSFEYIDMHFNDARQPGRFMLHDGYFINDTTLCSGSWGAGTVCYSVSQDQWVRYHTHPAGAYWGNIVFTVLPASQTRLWVAGTAGFGQLDLGERSYEFYRWDPAAPTAIDSSFWYNTLCRTTQGNMVVTRTHGISISSPVDSVPTRLSFPPLLRAVYIDDVPMHSDTAVHYVREIQLSEPSRDITLALLAPGYYGPEQPEFECFLEGHDSDWRPILEGRTARYTDLPGGTFTFRYRASLDGDEWLYGTPLLVDRNVFFWRTPWFIGLVVTGIVAIIFIIYQLNLRNVRREAALKAEFDARLAEVELQALRAQMNPHFMFNSLNSIKHFILTHEPLKASEYLTNFATLIRAILHNSRERLIPMSKELEALMLYIELEQLRFDNQFEVHCRISEPLDMDSIMIPPLIMQPYVENAIWHGLLHKQGGGVLTIDIQSSHDKLYCMIEDNGIGRAAAQAMRSKSATRHKSMGMGITQDRIQILNKMDAYGIEVQVEDKYDDQGQPTGTRVTIEIPLT